MKETQRWSEKNKPTKISKLTKYADDILYLKEHGFSCRQIKDCLLEVYKLHVSTRMISYYYKKYLEGKEVKEISKGFPKPKEEIKPKEEEVKKETSELNTDKGGSSSKSKPKRTVAEFIATDPMFQKVLNQNKEEKK